MDILDQRQLEVEEWGPDERDWSVAQGELHCLVAEFGWDRINTMVQQLRPVGECDWGLKHYHPSRGWVVSGAKREQNNYGRTTEAGRMVSGCDRHEH